MRSAGCLCCLQALFLQRCQLSTPEKFAGPVAPPINPRLDTRCAPRGPTPSRNYSAIGIHPAGPALASGWGEGVSTERTGMGWNQDFVGLFVDPVGDCIQSVDLNRIRHQETPEGEHAHQGTTVVAADLRGGAEE